MEWKETPRIENHRGARRKERWQWGKERNHVKWEDGEGKKDKGKIFRLTDFNWFWAAVFGKREKQFLLKFYLWNSYPSFSKQNFDLLSISKSCPLFNCIPLGFNISTHGSHVLQKQYKFSWQLLHWYQTTQIQPLWCNKGGAAIELNFPNSG